MLKGLTKSQIDTLKQNINLSGVAKSHGLASNTNHIYKIMRRGSKRKGSKAYKIMTYLYQELNRIEKIAETSA